MGQNMSDRINEALVKAGVKVEALIPKEASLEDTFIRLTSDEAPKGEN
jgi:hypothetical protein